MHKAFAQVNALRVCTSLNQQSFSISEITFMKFRRICRLNPTAALLQPTETVSAGRLEVPPFCSGISPASYPLDSNTVTPASRQITVRKSADSPNKDMKRVSLHPVRAAAAPVTKHGMRLTLMYRSENRFAKRVFHRS